MVFQLNIVTYRLLCLKKFHLKGLKYKIKVKFNINPRTYTQIHHRGTMVGGRGGMEPILGVFDMLQYFETILPLVENL